MYDWVCLLAGQQLLSSTTGLPGNQFWTSTSFCHDGAEATFFAGWHCVVLWIRCMQRLQPPLVITVLLCSALVLML